MPKTLDKTLKLRKKNINIPLKLKQKIKKQPIIINSKEIKIKIKR